MELPDDEALVMVGGGRPIRARKIRYFDDGSFSSLLHPPAAETMNERRATKSVWFQERYGPTSQQPEAQITDLGVDDVKTVPHIEDESKPIKARLNHPNKRRKKTEPLKSRSSIEDLEVGDLA
jgi:type IV secretory pathway TraG/TraD family ATPase VirD4